MADERRPENRLDAGARGGLVGQAAVVAGFVSLAALYSTRPVLSGAIMLAAGAIALAVAWRVAARRRRYFSAVQWLMLSLLLLALFGVLHAAPTDELRQYYREDPSRERNVLLIAAVLAGVGLVSFWMLRRRPDGDQQRKDDT